MAVPREKPFKINELKRHACNVDSKKVKSQGEITRSQIFDDN